MPTVTGEKKWDSLKISDPDIRAVGLVPSHSELLTTSAVEWTRPTRWPCSLRRTHQASLACYWR